jgi:hypothetical protein
MSRRLVNLATLAVLLGACAGGLGGSPTPPPTVGPPIELWPLPSDPLGLARAAGLEPETIEHLEYHVHAHLDVFKDGQPVIVPGGIGIDITDPQVKRFDVVPEGPSYGGIRTPCDDPCISTLHTHDPDGVLHIESKTPSPDTLGQLLIEWDVTLPEGTKAYVNGREWTDDIASIELSDGREIALIIGTPPSTIPASPPPPRQ